jgi:hypothetical protein
MTLFERFLYFIESYPILIFSIKSLQLICGSLYESNSILLLSFLTLHITVRDLNSEVRVCWPLTGIFYCICSNFCLISIFLCMDLLKKSCFTIWSIVSGYTKVFTPKEWFLSTYLVILLILFFYPDNLVFN